MEPYALYEERLWVHDRDVDRTITPEPVGRHRAGVARTQYDNVRPLPVSLVVADLVDVGGVHGPAFRGGVR